MKSSSLTQKKIKKAKKKIELFINYWLLYKPCTLCHILTLCLTFQVKYLVGHV